MEKPIKPKLREILGLGYKETGKKYKILSGIHKGNEFPVYAMEGDVAGLVYKMPFPFTPNDKNGLNLKKEHV
ncbi:MAG: hypothetical protein KA120_07970 [Candidatus Goldbacteria bacterium]|nr:hypothetical protein [Candidatus Goldiibacteriota bacterium]